MQSLLQQLRFDRAVGFVWKAAPGWTAVGLALILVQSLVPIATLYVMKLLVDRLTELTAGNGLTDSFSQFLILIGLALIVTITGLMCNALLSHANTNQGQLVADHMQHIVQSKSIELDLEYYENSQFFDNLHRAQREAPGRPVRIVEALTQIARYSLTLLAALVVLFTFHWLVVLAVFAASIPVIYYRLRYAQDLFDLQVRTTNLERQRRYLNQLLTSAESAKEVRVFGFGPHLISRYVDYTRSLREGIRKLSAHGTSRQFVTETAAAIAAYLSLAIIVHGAVVGKVTLGQLLLYFGAFQIAMNALRPTLSGLSALYENSLFLSSLYEFLEVPQSVPEPTKSHPVPRPWQQGLLIQNLNFTYPGTRERILENVNLCIRPGEIVALVGHNGTGKTTLTKLLCRLYDPTEGRITIDGIDLKEFRTRDLRNQLSVIYQDFGRYHMTARDNIRLGSPDLIENDDSVVKAAKWAGIHDEISALPNGYDTVMSRSLADGEELSIGQWQKLALARAFVRDSQLIILDEPTSSLDAAAEFTFFEKFREMAQGRSALIISHRFSTVRLADRVYVLDKGRMVESGTHAELIARNGLYARLYRKQASYYSDHSSLGNESTTVPHDHMSAAES